MVKEKIKSDLVREPSDIDIVIVAKKDDVMKIKSELTSFVNKEIVARYGIVAFPIVLSYQEYTKGLNNDQFIINVHARGELLYGEKPRKFS